MSKHVEIAKMKEHPVGKREKLPPKGTAARLLRVAGLWSHMPEEEIERIKKDIFESRKSSR